ncbi:type II toxin-antitoxin system Phd/YefM family antitoxin [Methylophilus methylotrophus]|jgi:prevent-host-death family protein|uniref:type II toxin-antitoxin system Phd/YefM family antitoxin n=1 Tax=Methylophilus methylotrophus TaxID=17 RepID=UPI00233EA2C5|nr:type II toxin-antitoxin system prevent-host-death family antitoxin [Methylophilus methylotrophus]
MMQTVNMLEAKTTLSRLVESVESGETEAVIIARNGRPAAKLVAIDAATEHKRLGVAKGKFVVPESIDTHNAEVARLFMGQ